MRPSEIMPYIRKSLAAKSTSPFKRMPSNSVRYHRTSTDWLATGTIVRTHAKTNRRVINTRPSPQSETKSRRAEANQGHDPAQDPCRGVPLSDRTNTGTIQQLPLGLRTSFAPLSHKYRWHSTWQLYKMYSALGSLFPECYVTQT
jgi:hypothetical protein